VKGVVNLNSGLFLALTLALVLGVRRRDKLLSLLLGEGLGVGPGLVRLTALVGFAELELAEAELLLGTLRQKLVERDLLDLGLGRLGRCAIGWVTPCSTRAWVAPGGSSLGALSAGIAFALGESLLLVVLGNLLSGLLVVELGLALGGAPRLGSLLLRATDAG